jgi:hypothetical protein
MKSYVSLIESQAQENWYWGQLGQFVMIAETIMKERH